MAYLCDFSKGLSKVRGTSRFSTASLAYALLWPALVLGFIATCPQAIGQVVPFESADHGHLDADGDGDGLIDVQEGAALRVDGANTDYLPGEMIASLRVPVDGNRAEDVAAALDAVEEVIVGSVLRRFALRPGERTILVQLPADLSVADAVNRTLALRDAGVVYAEPNHVVWASDTLPNDPAFNLLWGLHNTGQTGGVSDADIDAPAAWDTFTGSSSAIVAVIDSGVDYAHPDLAPNIWRNPGETGGGKETNGIDDDGNGYVDDVYGFDFHLNDPDPMDANGHGTHVAGTIAAVGDNGLGVVGVTWTARIMCLRFLGAGGSGSSFAAAEAINYATMMGAKITNNSWGGVGFSQTLLDAITAARDAGVLVVAAAGNFATNIDTFPFYPASYSVENVVSVASTDHNDQLSSFSNWGVTSVDLGAPGSNIYSSVPPFTSLFFESFQSTIPPGIGSQLTAEGSNNFWGTIDKGDGNIALRGDAAQSNPYRGNADGSVVTPAFDTLGLPGLALSFQYRYEMESNDDAFTVEVWDGANWIAIFQRSSDCCLRTWYYNTILDLEPYRNGAMRIRFSWQTDGDANDYYGAEIDNISIRYVGNDYAGQGYGYKSGTSMASPHVAGAAAFFIGQDPGLGLTELKDKIMQVDWLASLDGRVLSSGRLNLAQTGPGGPLMTVDPDQLANTTPLGEDASSQGFTICSSGDPVSFTITDDADWLEYTPASGTAGSGEACASVTVEYATAALLDGFYQATITIESPESLNSPVYLPVSLVVRGGDCTTQWADGPMLPTGRGGACSAVLDGRLYIIGGGPSASFASTSTTVEIYDPASDTWSAGTPLQTERTWAGCAVVDGKIYAIGGSNASGYLTSVEEFDPAENTWTYKAPMPSSEWGGNACATWNDKVYVFLTGHTYEYDVANDLWATKTRMPRVRADTRAAKIGDAIYLVGGFNGGWKDYVDLYHPGTDTWGTKAALPSPRGHVLLTPFGGKLYAIAGLGAEGDANVTVEYYDPASDTWAADTPITTGRYVAAGATLGGNIFVCGGYQAINSVEIASRDCDCDPPLEPANPDPADGAVDVPPDTDLAWNGDRGIGLLGAPIDGAPGLLSTGAAVANAPGEHSASLKPLKRKRSLHEVIQSGQIANPLTAPAPMNHALVIDLPVIAGGEVSGAASYLPADWVVPARSATTLTIEPGYRRAVAPVHVLLLTSGSDPTILRTALAAFPDIDTVDYFDAWLATPVLADLMPYDVVVAMSVTTWADATLAGDVLADYVDIGGKVIASVATFATGGNWELEGRFVTQGGYEPFVHGSGEFFAHSLGAFDAGHPIMSGVASLTDGLPAAVGRQPGAIPVAEWDNGTPLVATVGDSVVGINLFVFDSGNYTGDVALLYHNAVVWLADGDPSCSATYDVYLGADPDALELICSDVSEPVCDPGLLECATTYYWQVVAKNSAGETPGPVWSFTTGCDPCEPPPEPVNPDPADGASDVPLDADLAWNTARAAHAPVERGVLPPGFVVRAGVLVEGEPRDQPPTGEAARRSPSNARRLEGATLIDFDDVNAPCGFASTVRLTSEYAALGVVFEGPGGNDGGAILDECGNFGVSGHSSPNFLAFNVIAGLSDGGTPRGPETLHFSPAVSFVEALVGSRPGVGRSVTMEAFGADGGLLDSAVVTFSSVLAPISVSGAGIVRVVVSAPDTANYVLDDLTFSAQIGCDTTHDVYFGTEPTPSTLVCTNTNGLVCDPGELAPNTTYYWQVVAKNPAGETAGDVWSFTTGGDCDPPSEPANPEPADGAVDVLVDQQLAWNGVEAAPTQARQTIDNELLNDRGELVRVKAKRTLPRLRATAQVSEDDTTLVWEPVRSAVQPLVGGGVAAAGPLLPDATRTIFLERGPGPGSAPMNVAYHPGFGNYYASSGGHPSYAAWVYDGDGNRIQEQTPLGIDVRAWNYNPSTAQLEVVTYNAIFGDGGNIRGLIEPGVDGSGLLTGTTGNLRANLPGLNGTQTMPAYDASRDEFYSRSTGATVNRVRRSDGSLVGVINLDLAAAGNPLIVAFAIGWDPSNEWLLVADYTNNRALAFDLGGSFIGAANLDIALGNAYRVGFANGQLFVFDSARNGWQGYVIEGDGPCPTTYDVYFGTDPTCSELTTICEDVTEPTCDPGLLDENTTYYWQVVAKNPAGETQGPCWSFTTRGSEDFAYRCVIVAEPNTMDQTATLPEGITAAGLGDSVYVEFWATDSGTINTGLVSVYADVDYPEDLVSCVPPVGHTALFNVFPDGECTGLIVDELGGTQFAEDVGVEPEWARVAFVEFTCDVMGLADFALAPATGESSAHGRGEIPPSDIDYGMCGLDIHGCPCIYDLDGNCDIAGGDLGLFAPCWLCCDDQPCWEANACGDKDWDCNGCVAGGDLGWFAGGWLASCSELDPVVDYPSCRECDGPIECPWPAGLNSTVPAAITNTLPTQQDVVLLALRVTRDPSQLNQTTLIGQSNLGVIRDGERVFGEIWAKDTALHSQGLTAVFVDLLFDPSQFAAVAANPDDDFMLFSDASIDNADGVVWQVGGATLDAGHGLHAWRRVAVIVLDAVVTVENPDLTIAISDGESVVAHGRGLLTEDHVRIINLRRPGETTPEPVR